MTEKEPTYIKEKWTMKFKKDNWKFGPQSIPDFTLISKPFGKEKNKPD
jgi:hypothetical protein